VIPEDARVLRDAVAQGAGGQIGPGPLPLAAHRVTKAALLVFKDPPARHLVRRIQEPLARPRGQAGTEVVEVRTDFSARSSDAVTRGE